MRINEKLEKFKMGSCAKSIRNDLSKGKKIFSEESSRAINEMGNMELIELRQTLATSRCPSCLKHLLGVMNMCQCGVWLRPNQCTMERIRTAFAALNSIFSYHRNLFKRVDIIHGRQIMPKPWMHEEEQAELRDLPSFSIGARLD